MLLEFKKKYWRKSKIFNWGFVDRDNWIKEQSKKIKKGSLILDVGAGTGPYRELFAGSDYRTHDLMPHSDDNNRAGQSYTQIDYISDIIELPIEDNIFDVVICTEVIEHVPEPIKALGEIVRVCKPGGLIILSAPLAGFVHQEPYHFYGGFSPYWYTKFLTKFGASKIKIECAGKFFKFFNAVSIRFANFLSPKLVFQNSLLLRYIYTPIWWLLIVPIFGLLIPFISYWLDPLDKTVNSTAGYHVIAYKD